jgi:uncharacterized protein with HEPN domain
MPRNDDKLYLTDMVMAADDIAEFIAGYYRETFLSDKVTQSAVIQKIITIGEVANAVSAELKAKHPAVDWSGVIKMRNRVTHGYRTISHRIVWDVATQDIPILRDQVNDILKAEF